MMRPVISSTALAALLIAGTAIAAPSEQSDAQQAAPPAVTSGSAPSAPTTSAAPVAADASTTPPASAASTAPPAAKLSPADQKRLEAIQQYQHDLVSVVALRADSDYLLGAAILAKPFENQTPGLDFDALSQRAAAAPSAGSAPRWERLSACKSKDDCPNADAYAYLRKQAADNAAVWIVAMDLAAQNHDGKAERVALQKVAAAETYDDYYGKALAGVAKATAVLPPLADTMQGAHDDQPDNPDGVRVLVAVNATEAHLRPDLDPVLKFCSKDAVARDKGSRNACLKLAHTLQWGSSPMARAAGLHIQAELVPVDKAQDEQASRDLAWQVHQYSGLLQRALVDPSLAAQWLASARNGGTELSLILATLRTNHVPTDAPSGATPASAGSGGQ
jgi:hypothetical protein